jgi:hypothetical protein
MPNAPHFATTDSVEDTGTVRLAGESACPTGADVGQALSPANPNFPHRGPAGPWKLGALASIGERRPVNAWDYPQRVLVVQLF